MNVLNMYQNMNWSSNNLTMNFFYVCVITYHNFRVNCVVNKVIIINGVDSGIQNSNQTFTLKC